MHVPKVHFKIIICCFLQLHNHSKTKSLLNTNKLPQPGGNLNQGSPWVSPQHVFSVCKWRCTISPICKNNYIPETTATLMGKVGCWCYLCSRCSFPDCWLCQTLTCRTGQGLHIALNCMSQTLSFPYWNTHAYIFIYFFGWFLQLFRAFYQLVLPDSNSCKIHCLTSITAIIFSISAQQKFSFFMVKY